MTLADITIDHITSGGLTTAIAYAALQIGRGVAAVSTFLGKLGERWDAEEKHREAEAEHWELVVTAIETHAEQQGQIIQLLARPGVRAQA